MSFKDKGRERRWLGHGEDDEGRERQQFGHKEEDRRREKWQLGHGEVCEMKLIVPFGNVLGALDQDEKIILVSFSWHLKINKNFLSLSLSHAHYASSRFSFLWNMKARGGDGVQFHFLCILQPLSICLFVSLSLCVSLRFSCFWSMRVQGGGGVQL